MLRSFQNAVVRQKQQVVSLSLSWVYYGEGGSGLLQNIKVLLKCAQNAQNAHCATMKSQTQTVLMIYINKLNCLCDSE